MAINNHICFIGGDERQAYAVKQLADYIDINTSGKIFDKVKHSSVSFFENPIKAIYGARAIILPVPASASENVVSFSELIDMIRKNDKNTYILGGKFSPYLKGIIQKHEMKYDDYYEDECFTIRNAYLTAEGAIQLAMSALKGTIRFSKCAILGYGRIGKALGDILKNLHADVTVFARREDTLVLANENGLKTQNIDSRLNALSKGFDLIFNTIPERIIYNEELLSIPTQTTLIELASPPGGFDPDIATQCDVQFINGRGLPGKYAPEAAGRITADTIIKYLKKEGIL